MRLAWFLAVAVLLAGCSQSTPGTDDQEPGQSTGSAEKDILQGWVLDAAVAPVVGASVTIPGENRTVTTDAQGAYGFGELPPDRPLVVVASAEGYKPLSKSITLKPDQLHRMNFTLERVPVKEPSMEKQAFSGFIGCAGVLRTEESRENMDCSSISPQDERVWEFNVRGDTKGIVVEADWEAQTELAKHLNITVETVDFGGFDEILAQEEGGTMLRAQVTQEKADRFYRSGGTVRVTVDIGRNIEEEEAGAGLGFAAQQDFELFASVFYVAPPPAGYSVAS